MRPLRQTRNAMQISLDSEVAEKLHALLEQEDDDAVFRIRETKVGAG